MAFSLLEQLKQPFPEQRGGRKSVVDSAATGLFVAAFLYFLQPFDMSRSGIPPLWHSLAYGVVTFVVNVSYNWFCNKVLNLQTDIESWTLWKWVVRVTGLIVCIAIGNFLYFNYSYDWNDLNLGTFSRTLSNTFLVGIFPTIAFGLIMQLRAAQSNVQSASEIVTPATTHTGNIAEQQSDAKRAILSFGEMPSDKLDLEADAIRYIEAMQNYVSICHIADGKLNRHLIRQTLSSTEQQCLNSTIVRCHRSFLVNTMHIHSVSGNAQGLKLKLHKVDDTEVPVSRSYISKLKQFLDSPA